MAKCSSNKCNLDDYDDLMSKINASDDNDESVWYAKAAAWMVSLFREYLESMEQPDMMVEIGIMFLETSGFSEIYHMLRNSINALDARISESFERNSGHYQVSVESCDFYDVAKSFGRPDVTPVLTDDIFEKNAYTSQCRWQIVKPNNNYNKLPLYGTFYAEKVE